MGFQFSVAQFAVKVLIHAHHQISNFFNSDCEAKTFEHVMELFNLNEVVFVIIDLIEHLLQCQSFLLQNFH